MWELTDSRRLYSFGAFVADYPGFFHWPTNTAARSSGDIVDRLLTIAVDGDGIDIDICA